MPVAGILLAPGAPVPADAQGALWHPSPNFGPRRDGAGVSLVVIHYTAMESAEAALQRLSDPTFEVSAHYLIGDDGTLWQMVREAERAWHAGFGEWGGRADVNSRSIGIELDNPSDQPFPAVQMEVLQTLLQEVLARHDLPEEAVIGHSDMAPERKRDPGRLFDWRALAAAGLSVWPEPLQDHPAADEGRFLADAHRFGYPETDLAHLLDAVRQRFRPEATGPMSPEDMAIVADLARRFPVDRAAATS
ncbi:MAG: N-acetylmuramoyl-L-alanine amidase [Pseudomonadota bacterium]